MAQTCNKHPEPQPPENLQPGGPNKGSRSSQRCTNYSAGPIQWGRSRFARGTPDADHLKYDHQRVFASATKLWQGGLRGSLGVDLGKRDFVGIYPLTSEARDDSYYKVQFGLSHSQIDIMGFRPTLNCSHTLNRSNVSFYDYGATECQATLNRNF